MLTFQEIFAKLPVLEEKSPVKFRYIVAFVIACLTAFAGLLFIGNHLHSAKWLYATWVPLLMIPLGLIAEIVLEVRHGRRLLVATEGKLFSMVDRRFTDQKTLAAELALEDLFELKQMRDKLESELLSRERWVEVLKPFSILVPAALIIVTADVFNIPNWLQNVFKVLGASILAGLTIGAISTYTDIVKLRRVSSILQHAIGIGEKRKEAGFRKVSRKRGVSI